MNDEVPVWLTYPSESVLPRGFDERYGDSLKKLNESYRKPDIPAQPRSQSMNLLEVTIEKTILAKIGNVLAAAGGLNDPSQQSHLAVEDIQGKVKQLSDGFHSPAQNHALEFLNHLAPLEIAVAREEERRQGDLAKLLLLKGQVAGLRETLGQLNLLQK